MAVDPSQLRACALFEGITDDDLTVIAEKMERREVVPGEHLTREGASGYFFFVIFEGTAEVSRDGARVNTLGAGDFFGEIALIYDNARRTATVTAASPLRFFVLTRQSFRSLLEHQPEIEEKVMAALERRLAAD
jgi:CRP/FNR family cyclic AMP-dependent transcriptional regulator